MIVKYAVSNIVSGTEATVIYEGEANTPEEALAAVAKLTGTAPVVATRRPKVGDRVVAVKDSADNKLGSLIHYAGETGTVIEDDGSELPFLVQWDRGEKWWASEDEVAVITAGDTQPVQKEAPKPRVGATIRIVNPVLPIGYAKGDEGEITDFSPAGNYRVKFPQGVVPVCVYPREAEVIA